jgi:hypothetical protein
MKLRTPPYPDPVGTAAYYLIHAGHREIAIDTCIGIIRRAGQEEAGRPDAAEWAPLTKVMEDWAVESLLQGSWMREYHEWEKATKAYFDGNHARNGSGKVDWRGKLPGVPGASHVDRVRAQLTLFDATVPAEALDAIDRIRDQVNLAKHEAGHFVSEADYIGLLQAVMAFWEALSGKEEFTPPS